MATIYGQPGAAQQQQAVADAQAAKDANKKPIWDISQPYGGASYAPGGENYKPGTPGNVAPHQVASDRTGFANPNLPSLDSMRNNIGNPNLGVAGPQFNETPNVSSYLTNALDKKQGMGMSDFGIPAGVLDKMKAAEAQTINQGYDVQKEASKRLMHSMGLANDSANLLQSNNIDQSRLGDIFKSYNNADVTNAVEANKQYQQNLNDLVGAGSDLTKINEQGRQFNTNLGEQGRQFNVGAELTNAELGSKIEKMLADTGMDRVTMNESIAQWLEQQQLERLKMNAGLASSAVPMAGERLDNLQSMLGGSPTSYF